MPFDSLCQWVSQSMSDAFKLYMSRFTIVYFSLPECERKMFKWSLLDVVIIAVQNKEEIRCDKSDTKRLLIERLWMKPHISQLLKTLKVIWFILIVLAAY